MSLTSSGVTTSIGSLNSTWCHFNTTATTGFYFYKNIQTPLNITANSFIGSLTGNASSATYASAVTLTADNATNATRYPLFVDAATGNKSPRTDTGFTYNPSTGALTTSTFIGALSGNATSATSATRLTTINTYDANEIIGGAAFNYSSASYWVNAPSGMSYGLIGNIIARGSNSLSLQLAADINHNSTSSTKDLWFRTGNNLGFQND